ncbi:putative membrane protein [Candidatus Nanohalovita haloferacivicina]|nr:putative membrane protein [Candidatus Nanohalobia archaeon BNXNv]
MEKFWIPVADESVYYNPYNTTIYALLFGLAALYLVYPFSKKLGITFDRDFFKGIAPYAFLGGAVRSLKDINAVNSFLLETPFIYIVLFVFTVSAIKFSQILSDRTDYSMENILAVTGLIPLAVSLSFYSISNFAAVGLFLSLVLTWSLAGYAVLQLLRPDLLNYSFVVPVAAHFYDASTTVTALSFGGREKHVLGQFFIDVFGPYGMFLMKGLIIVPVVYYIVENMEGEERNYYLFLIALLGIAIGTRNILSTVALT